MYYDSIIWYVTVISQGILILLHVKNVILPTLRETVELVKKVLTTVLPQEPHPLPSCQRLFSLDSYNRVFHLINRLSNPGECQI